MGAALNKFIEDTRDVTNANDLIKIHIKDLINKITLATGQDFSKELLDAAEKNIETDRGKFIVETEAVVKIKRMGLDIIQKITNDAAQKKNILDIIANYPIPGYNKYLRFPFTDEVKYIKDKIKNNPIRKYNTGRITGGGHTDECVKLRVVDSAHDTVRTKTLTIFDKTLYLTNDIIFLHIKPGFVPEACLPNIESELFSSGKMVSFQEHSIESEITDRYSTQLISLGGKMFEIRNESPGAYENWKGKLADGKELNYPILIKGEADLLNSLVLSPANMGFIFHEGNRYGLTSWRTAFSTFFSNLLLTKCYKNLVLLTNSECRNSRNFLYSIREYNDKKFVKEDSDDDNDSDSSDDARSLVKSSEFDYDDADLNIGDIAQAEGVQKLEKKMEHHTFMMHERGGKWYPSVKVHATHKRSKGESETLILHLVGSERANKSQPVTQDEKTRLLEKITDLKMKYPNYIIHTY
jgi:hypothetical protein